MVRIFVVGSGNLGSHLISRFDRLKAGHSSPIQLVGYHNRTTGSMSHITARYYSNLEVIPRADLVLIAVNDDAIPQVVSSLNINPECTITHTSGSVGMNALNPYKNRGVFYFAQSFSTTREPDFSELTLCWEASNEYVKELLWTVGGTLSRKRTNLPSPQRKQLHLAAVYANNFVNHCYAKATALLEENELSPDLLHPLMRETLEKALAIGATAAQTGPARRNDRQTIERHLEQLTAHERDMYTAITQSILTTYEKL